LLHGQIKNQWYPHAGSGADHGSTPANMNWQMDMATQNTLDVGMFCYDIPEPVCANKTIFICFQDTTFNRGMMRKDDGRLLFDLR